MELPFPGCLSALVGDYLGTAHHVVRWVVAEFVLQLSKCQFQ